MGSKIFKNPIASRDPRLRPYQQEGVRFLRRHHGGILFWEMGTGKTRTALLAPRRFKRICIVAPKVTMGVWANECATVYDGHEPEVLAGTKFEDLDETTPIFWMNYEIVMAKWSWFQYNTLDALIIDEAHLIKSKRAQRTQAIHALCGCAKMVIALTGTPIYNKPRDLWSLLWAVQGGEWDPYYEFARRYCEGVPTGFGGYRAEGFSKRHKRELQGRLEDIVHRVRWLDVAKAPKMDRIRIPVLLNKAETNRYTRLARDARKVMVGYTGTASPAKAFTLTQIATLRQTLGRYKAKTVFEFLMTIPKDEKIVVWAHHHHVIDAIADKLIDAGEDVAEIHGKQTARKQRAQLDYFNHKARVIIVSLEAGALGIDLTKARFAVFAELSWTPAVLAQAERRTWRSTQKKSCLMYYLLAQNTIEDRMLDLLEKKVKLVYEAMDDAQLLQLVGSIAPKRSDIVASIIDMLAKGG